MKKIILFLMFIAALNGGAQTYTTNFNVVILAGSGNVYVNTTYLFNPGNPGGSATNGYFTNSFTVYLLQFISPAGTWIINNGYESTDFPYTWTSVGAFGTNPPPTGNWLITTNWPAPTRPQWSVMFTNFFTMPGDSVTFSGNGRNMGMSSNMVAMQILLDGNQVYTSSYTAGNGNAFSLSGRLLWDGTNLYSSAHFYSGDPSNAQSTLFNEFTNYPVGTNYFQLLSLGNTNALVFQQAALNASRAPGGTYLPASNSIPGPGSWTLQ